MGHGVARIEFLNSDPPAGDTIKAGPRGVFASRDAAAAAALAEAKRIVDSLDIPV